MSTQLFPSVQPETAAVEAAQPPMAREVKWDFERGRPVFSRGEPVLVEGVEAVLIWAGHALRTPRFRHEIFSWRYGCELESLIGQSCTGALKQAEALRYVREALTASPYITGVEEVSVDFLDGRLEVHCRVITIYGTGEVGASV